MPSDRKLLVGVDEAGYAPNLGPLVVAAVALEVPDDVASESLWDHLAPDVTRYPASDGEPLIIDDSKRVYVAANGLAHLERTALTLCAACATIPRTFRDLWDRHCLTPAGDMDENVWWDGDDLCLPI